MRRTRTSLIVLSVLSAAGVCPAEDWSLPLTIESAAGCRHDLRSARLLELVPAPDESGTIVIDASRPTRWSGGGASPPVGAEGELQLGFASYDLMVPDGGEYTLWAQFAAPRGRTQFVEMVNGRRITAPFVERNADAPAPRKWVRRFRTTLRPGLNRVSLAEDGRPFTQPPRLRRLAWAPDDDATLEGDGPLPALTEVPRTQVETAPITIPGLRRVLSVAGVGEEIPVSFRQAEEEWKPLPKGPFDARGPIRFRLELTADAPSIGPLSLNVETEAGALISLRSGETELLFDRAGGGLFLARNRRTGAVYVGGREPLPLSAVDFKPVGQAVWTRVDPQGVSRLKPKEQYSQGQWDLQTEESRVRPTPPDAVEFADGALTIRRTYAVEGLGSARVTETIAPRGDGAWRMAAQLEVDEGSADVVSLRFPSLDRVAIGDSGLDDEQLRLQSYGHRIVQPGRQPLRNDVYAGAVVMNWTQTFDAEGSLYLGVHDPRGTTTLHRSAAAGPEGEAVSLSVQRLDDVKAGERIAWETVLALGGGGWRDGARRYRDWFNRTHGRTDLPDWLRTADGWLNLQLENMPDVTFDDLPDHLSRARAAGLDWVQVWGQFGYDRGGPCCSAWYGPSPRFGGADGLRRAAAEIRERGGRFGGYFYYDTLDELPARFGLFLGRFRRGEYPPDLPWDDAETIHQLRLVADPTNPIPPLRPGEQELARWRERLEDHRRGREAGEPVGAVQWWTKAWIPEPRWRERMTDWIVDRYADAWNCNAVYLDVLGTGPAPLSYDPRRNHNGDGGWGEGRRLLARAVSERARQVDPEFGIVQEGLGDLPGLHAAKLVSGVYLGGRNVMRYAFPDRVLIHGMSNATAETSPLDRWLETFSEAMRFDIVGQPDALSLSLLTLVRSFTPELWQATFLDTHGLVADDRLVVRRLECGGALRGNLLTIVNRERTAGAEVAVDEGVVGPIGGAFAVEQSGAVRTLDLVRQGGQVAFEAPAALASLVFLAASKPGEATVRPIVRLRRESPPAVEVALLNLTDRPQTGVCRLAFSGLTEPYQDRGDEARAMLPLERTRLDYEIPPFETTTLRFPASRLDQLRWSVPLDVTLEPDEGEPDEGEPDEGEPSTRTTLLTPLILDGSFDYLDGVPAADADGGRALRLPSSEEYQYRTKDLWLLPDRRYRLTMRARRTGFDAAVQGGLIQIRPAEGETVDRWLRLDAARPDEWQTLTTEFPTPPDLIGVRLYLYNVRSPDTAWFDDVRLEDLGAVEEAGAALKRGP